MDQLLTSVKSVRNAIRRRIILQNDGIASFGEQSVLTKRGNLSREFASCPQKQIQCLFSTFSYEPNERSNITGIGYLKIFVIRVPMLLVNNNRRITSLHKDHIHEQARCSTISIGKRMYMHQFVMRQSCISGIEE